MSKTRSKIYADGYRAGRKVTRWERFKWLLFHRRAKVEEWLTDDNAKDADFLILLFAGLAVAAAGIAVWAASSLGA